MAVDEPVSTGLARYADQGRRAVVLRDWTDTVAQIRMLTSNDAFLRQPEVNLSLVLDQSGPVVVVNAAPWRSDALIVQDGAIDRCGLPDLDADELETRVSSYLTALQTTERAADHLLLMRGLQRGDSSVAARRDTQRAERELRAQRVAMRSMLVGTLAWLWDVVAEPVLAALRFTATSTEPDWLPRLWWCPIGALSLLPLHAAGRHDGGDEESVLDRAVSSYTPTLRALALARRPVPPTAASARRMLIVAQPRTPRQPPLPGVLRDVETLVRLFPDDHRTLLRDDDASRAAVLRALGEHRWVHFACHGTQDLATPVDGRLVLWDGTLSVADLGSRGFNGEFAGLAACKTATGGVHAPDEVVTLASALFYRGYRHVVATLWSVSDSTGASDLFENLYGRLVVDGELDAGHTATALHTAVRQLRADHRNRPDVWSPFVHIGP